MKIYNVKIKAIISIKTERSVKIKYDNMSKWKNAKTEKTKL